MAVQGMACQRMECVSPGEPRLRRLQTELAGLADKGKQNQAQAWLAQMIKGRPFVEPNASYRDFDLQNVSMSRCFNSNDISLWIGSRMAWPQIGSAPLPNPDLPEEVQDDYREASTIIQISPRGACALLRLSIQKTCKHLGEKGKNIDEDIAALVQKGISILGSNGHWM